MVSTRNRLPYRSLAGFYAASALIFLPFVAVHAQPEALVSGTLRAWHRVTIDFDGPWAAEAEEDNPFLNYRLVVTFINEDAVFTVPGFFAADGDAANSSAQEGSVWRVHFTPDRPGTWTYSASFRRGDDVAVSLEPNAGEPAAFDGLTGSFEIAESDKDGRDFRAHGRIDYVGARYLRHAGSGRYFLKGGAGSPETFLAYHDFDGTWDNGGIPLPMLDEGLHRYEPHVADWRAGDPTWGAGKGRGMIGGLNYLASQAVNSLYFITMNVAGDGDDVWPWTGPDERVRFDVSKLEQWEVVFSHMDSLGILLHVITQETENDTLLDGGNLGLHRKLYYRELVARFGHHLGVVWNLGEENNNTTEQLEDFAAYIASLDAYAHPIVVHNHVHLIRETFDPLLGKPHFVGPSFQLSNPEETHQHTRHYVEASRKAGRPWVVSVDEIGPWMTGVRTDVEDPDHDTERRSVLWPHLMAGGAGVEWYFGWGNDGLTSDLANEDWRNREIVWEQTKHALDFFHEHLPFPDMLPSDELASGAMAHALAVPGSIYALYLPEGGTPTLDLSAGARTFQVSWFDPKEGGPLQAGSITTVTGGDVVSLGAPPATHARDWVVLVTSAD